MSANSVAGLSEKLHIRPNSARFFWYGWTISMLRAAAYMKERMAKPDERLAHERVR
jgi:hypothetical protein